MGRIRQALDAQWGLCFVELEVRFNLLDQCGVALVFGQTLKLSARFPPPQETPSGLGISSGKRAKNERLTPA